jgi:glutathione S-transferase
MARVLRSRSSQTRAPHDDVNIGIRALPRHDIAAFQHYSRGDQKSCRTSKIVPHRSAGAAMFTLYSMQRSGNSYKARLALAQLGIPYRLVEIDILKGESHTPEFLMKNPNGQVPLLEVVPGRYLAESNAILWYIALGTSLVPDDRVERAEALQWMFFEQHSLEPNLGAAYFWLTLIKGGRELQSHAIEDWMEEGHRALGVMEKHLSLHDYVAAGHYTIADIALYAYTHVAHQCDYDMSAFPAVRAWLARVAAQPGYVAMNSSPTAAMTAAQ